MERWFLETSAQRWWSFMLWNGVNCQQELVGACLSYSWVDVVAKVERFQALEMLRTVFFFPVYK